MSMIDNVLGVSTGGRESFNTSLIYLKGSSYFRAENNICCYYSNVNTCDSCVSCAFFGQSMKETVEKVSELEKHKPAIIIFYGLDSQ